MANFEMKFPDDLLKDLMETDFDEVCEEMLNAAAPILEESMKSAAKATLLHDGESEMVQSIKATKAKKAKNGAIIVNVNPKGYSKSETYKRKTKSGNSKSYSVSNALKAIWKEYGVNGRQPPRPFIAKATNDATQESLEKMQDVYRKKVKI